MGKIICGSTYFFSCFSDFNPKDIDEIQIVKSSKRFRFTQQTTGNKKCLFKVVKRPKGELLKYTLSNPKVPPMAVGKFLIPEFNQKFKITIEDLKSLQPLFEKLDIKHQYEKVIFESYLYNNGFFLTDIQLKKAYESYCEARNKSQHQCMS